MLARYLYLGLNNCIQCGSFGFRPSFLCSICEWNLTVTSLNNDSAMVEVRGVVCFGLFRWQRDRNRILNRLAVALKGCHEKTAWDYFAEWTVAAFIKSDTFAARGCFVPCPARTRTPDHAHLFAEALSRLTGLPVVPALELAEDVKEQKNLSRKDRDRLSRSRFRLKPGACENFSQASDHVIYFVDDIITSGSTVASAKVHLKDLGHVKAISLIIRE